MKNSKFIGISFKEIFTMLFLAFFVFLFNLLIRQEKGDDSLLGKLKTPFSTPTASAHGGEESASCGCGCECAESGCCESGCAVTGQI